MHDTATIPAGSKPKRRRRWYWRVLRWGIGAAILFIAGLILLAQLFLNKVPGSYHAMVNPIAPPEADRYAALHLDGFESPYLGHTASANGKGGTMFGGAKTDDLDAEVALGLRWTFLPVDWRDIESAGPVDLAPADCPQCRQLDGFVVAAHRRKLNILLQIVIGGNAGGPPDWAGRREAGKSAPVNMTAAAAFTGKLAARYAPGGFLALHERWPDPYGVRAWELDNEPESYRTCWKNQAGDYAEFATLSANAIRQIDPQAMIAVAATAGGDAKQFLAAALDATKLQGSGAFNAAGLHYSIGPAADVVSFHCYEGLETSFMRADRSIVDDLTEVRDSFDEFRTTAPGFTYASKKEYWHTEGNFDFLGVLSAKRRAAWRFQFMTRAFAAGLTKVCVMDPSKEESAAVTAYIAALTRPFPMAAADDQIKVTAGRATAFRHLDAATADAGQVWVVWPVAGSGDARVRIPAAHERVKIVGVDGIESFQSRDPTSGEITLDLKGDEKMAAGAMVIDRP